MSPTIDPGIVALFGGEVRVLTLAALSGASRPITGYRIARLTGAQPIKVYSELRRLAEGGLVVQQSTDSGARGWRLVDPDLRGFLNRRVRLNWPAPGERKPAEGRPDRVALRSQLRRLELSRYRPRPRSVPNRREFLRSASKDALLASAGLRTSRRGTRSR